MTNSEAWSRQDEEPVRWYNRFLVFRDLGPDRSLLGAVNAEKARKGAKRRVTSLPNGWSDTAERWRWKERAEAYDTAIFAEQERRAAILRQMEAEEIERILTTDYAAKHKRVEALARMAHIVEKSFIDPDSGEVQYKYMSPEKLKEWRGMLDDIAKELGHRIKETRLTGKDGGAIEIETHWGGGINEE